MSCSSWFRCVPSPCPEIVAGWAETSVLDRKFWCVPIRCVPIGKSTGAHRRGRKRAPPASPLCPESRDTPGHTRTHRGASILAREWFMLDRHRQREPSRRPAAEKVRPGAQATTDRLFVQAGSRQ